MALSRRQRNREIGIPERCQDTQTYRDHKFRCLLAVGHEEDHTGIGMIGDNIIEISWFPQGYATKVIQEYKNEIHDGELPK